MVIPEESDLMYFIPEKRYGIIFSLVIGFTMTVLWPATIFCNYFIYDESLNGRVEL